MEDISIARIILLSLIILIGVPGNFAALILSAQSVWRKRRISLAYLHLASVDCILCSVHATIVITLESTEYYSYYNDGKNYQNFKDFSGWEPVLKFIYEEVSTRMYISCTFISTLTLTFIAGYRTWRIFYPFARLRKFLVVGFFVLSDTVVVLLAFFFQIPNYRESTSNIENSTTHNSGFGITANMSIHDFGMAERNEILALESGISSVNTSTMVIRNSERLISGTPMVILVAFIGASILLTILFYIFICIKLRYDFQKSNFGEGNQRKLFLRRQVKHLVTHAVLFVVMITTFLPGFIFAVIHDKSGTAILRLMTAVAEVSSAINPFVYSLLLPGNKAALKQICGCDKRKGQNESINKTKLSTINI